METRIFPKESDYEDIRQWALAIENIRSLNGRLIVTDETSQNGLKSAISTAQNFKILDNFEVKQGYLDHICNRASGDAVLGRNWEMNFPYENPEGGKQSFIEVLNRVFERPENVPAQVTILFPRLADHWGGINNKENAEAEVAEALKAMLIEAGLPNDRIIFDKQADFDTVSEVDRPNNWILTDRHFLGWRPPEGQRRADLESLSDARVLFLPWVILLNLYWITGCFRQKKKN